MQHPKLHIPYALLEDAARLSRAAELFDKISGSTFSVGPNSIYQMKFRDGHPVFVGSLYATSEKCHDAASNALLAASIIEPCAKDIAAWSRQMSRMTAYLLQDRMLRTSGKSWSKEDLVFLVTDSSLAPEVMTKDRFPDLGTIDGSISDVFTVIGIWWPTEDGSKLEYLPPDRSATLIYKLRDSARDKGEVIRGC